MRGVAEGLCSKYGSHVKPRELSSRLNTLWSEVHHRVDASSLDSESDGDTESNAGYDGGQDNADLAGGPSFPVKPSVSLWSEQ